MRCHILRFELHADRMCVKSRLLATVPVVLACGYVRLRMLAESESRQRNAYNGVTALAIESCRNRSTVTFLGLEDFCSERFRTAIRLPFHEGLAFTIFSNILLAFSLSITYFVYALAYWWLVAMNAQTREHYMLTRYTGDRSRSGLGSMNRKTFSLFCRRSCSPLRLQDSFLAFPLRSLERRPLL